MDTPQTRRIAVTEEQIRAMARGNRDFILQVTGEGDVSARCKACATNLQIMRAGALLWFRCSGCQRESFYPVANVERDCYFAGKDGQPFVSELFYMKQRPPGLTSPFDAISDTQQ